jgi:FKBP-type peptidyl-prolyl cis-trans isomerase FkpA
MATLGSSLCILMTAAPPGDAEPGAKPGDPAGERGRRYVTVPAPNGIRIRRFEQTKGKKPGPKDNVVVHYHGTLRDGTVFDSSVERGRPAAFSLDGVIPCWQEAITRMRVGEKAMITCPPKTAYGLKGQPPRIPANATLKFEVELIAVR